LLLFLFQLWFCYQLVEIKPPVRTSRATQRADGTRFGTWVMDDDYPPEPEEVTLWASAAEQLLNDQFPA